VESDAQAKTFATRPGVAQIYLYRNENFGAGFKMEVYLDGQEVAATLAKTYVVLVVPPGPHRVGASSGHNLSTVEVFAVPGQNYFVWQEIKFGMEADYLAPRTLLHIVDDRTGEAGVRQCELVDAAAYERAQLHCPPGVAKACSFGYCSCLEHH
jgi:hypothetical protein